MKSFNTINESAKTSFIEKKSEFIGEISPAKSEEAALEVIRNTRESHRKARHVCYAYIISGTDESGNPTPVGETARFSDNGEPSGTAGAPILEVLRKNGLSDTVLTVTRYFGGVLLGAGGLTRAYTKSAADAVAAARIVRMSPAMSVSVKADYSYYGRIAATVADFGGFSENESFSDTVEVTAVIPLEKAESFSEKLVDLCNGNIFVEFAQKSMREFGRNLQN
ncbi:MAG: YigZ family protein [Oscillospiraceae bacterium]|nr:YigZ family protein [Oscillospiraceae bacterium]